MNETLAKALEFKGRTRGALTDAAVRAACVVLEHGGPLDFAAETAGTAASTLRHAMMLDDEIASKLCTARAKGKFKLLKIVHDAAESDPKWAAWMLERFKEFRPKVDIGELAEEFSDASNMSEGEIRAQMFREIAFPNAIMQQALDMAFEKPGPKLREKLEAWSLKHSPSLEAAGEEVE